MKSRLFIALILSLSLTLSGCNMSRRGATEEATGPKTAKYGDPNAAVGKSPDAQAPGAQQSSAPSGSQKNQKSASSNPAGTVQTSSALVRDNGTAGANNARLILGKSNYTEIVFEIDWVKGREPNQPAIDHLVQITREIAPGKNIVVKGGNEIPAQGGSYTGERLVEIGNSIRSTRSTKTSASIWIGYLDGNMFGAPAPGAAGVAMNGTTVAAVFPDTLNAISPSSVGPRIAIEKTVLIQEVAHLLALINIGYKSPRDHEHPDYPHHSKNPNSVMYHALMTGAGLKDFVLRGAEPPNRFDKDDLADLADLREGRL